MIKSRMNQFFFELLNGGEEITHEFIETAVCSFTSCGGEIEVLPPQPNYDLELAMFLDELLLIEDY